MGPSLTPIITTKPPEPLFQGGSGEFFIRVRCLLKSCCLPLRHLAVMLAILAQQPLSRNQPTTQHSAPLSHAPMGCHKGGDERLVRLLPYVCRRRLQCFTSLHTVFTISMTKHAVLVLVPSVLSPSYVQRPAALSCPEKLHRQRPQLRLPFSPFFLAIPLP